MSSEVEKRPTSRIDAVMALRFDECSLAAASACDLANKALKFSTMGSKFTEPHTILWKDTMVDAMPMDMLGIGLGDKIDMEGRKQYSLIRPDSGVPYLLGRISTSLCLPVASFHKKPGSQCSYVQLGQEMYDDDFVIGPKDKRRPVIESIRYLLSQRVDSHLNLTAGVAALDAYFNTLKDEYSSVIADKESQCYAWDLHRLFNDKKKTRQGMWLQNEAHEPVFTQRDVVRLTPNSVPPHFLPRPIRYTLTSSEDASTIEFVAVTRDNIALTMATAHKNGSWEFNGHDTDTSPTSYQNLAKLAHHAIVTEQELQLTFVAASQFRKRKTRRQANFLRAYSNFTISNGYDDLLSFIQTYYPNKSISKKAKKLGLPEYDSLTPLLNQYINRGLLVESYNGSGVGNEYVVTADIFKHSHPMVVFNDIRSCKANRNIEVRHHIRPTHNRSAHTLYTATGTEQRFEEALGIYNPQTDQLWATVFDRCMQSKQKKIFYGRCSVWQY